MAKLEPRGRKVKILATLGPACRDPEMLRRLLHAGADAFRVNMSHGDHETHAETISGDSRAGEGNGRPIAILCDLQGPKLRVGTFRDGEARDSPRRAVHARPRATSPATRRGCSCRIPNCSGCSRRGSGC